MAFIPTDLYLTSGSIGVMNSWTPVVTKFDTSTFYNWEQDNEPLYDLDERTEYLWERLGYPVQDGFSGITGKVFVVSADAPFAIGSDSSGVVFRDLSTVINVLPNPITYPIIIEVASFGDLGELCLNNIKIDDSCPGAGLEIVNRNFGRTTQASGAIFSDTATNVSSTDLYNTLTTTSSIRINAPVASAVADARWAQNRGWITPLGVGYSQYGIGRTYLNFNANTLVTTNKVKINTYNSTQDATITTNDRLVVSGADATTFYNDNTNAIASDNVRCFAAIYGNYLSKVKIDNCAGPIYIRNFCVDGGGATSGGSLAHTTESGFDITNSNVVLENSLAIRCKGEGFKFVNSNVTIRRGLFAARNYPLISSSARDTSKIGVGLLAKNSVINVQSQSTPVVVSGIDIPLHFAYNDIGLHLINSEINGGDFKKTSGDFTGEFGVNLLYAMSNTSCGIKLDNSVYKLNAATNATVNYDGIQMVNSIAEFPMLNIAYNQRTGLNAVNSVIIQNPNNIKVDKSDSYYDDVWQVEQFTFAANGQHLILDNSKLDYKKDVNMPSKFGTSLFHASLGYLNIGSISVNKPSIELKNNSYANFIHSKIQQINSNAPFNTIGYNMDEAIFGACLKVSNNSKAHFLASKTAPTILLGATAYQTNTALAYAENNSEIEFNGNTFIGQGAVDVLVDKNSTVKFKPHTMESGSFDASSWDLTDENNHTKVELHSTRACLVADNKSSIVMENLGHISYLWPNSQTSSTDFDLETSSLSASGYMQFYPNGQDQVAVTAQATAVINVNTTINGFNGRLYNNTSRKYFLVDYKAANASSTIATHSTGGMCVRALNGSKVKVFNVHFPAGWNQCNGIFYDVSSTSDCDKLRIWNICDNSELDAAFCSVSGMYPSLTGYKGPSAVYLSGAGVVASGAPAGTPDTGRTSVLDFYGASGANTGSNYGPFRLYFSPEGRAKFVNTNASDAGIVYQVLSQGYNPSANCSALSNTLSSIYADITSSQFYYVSAMQDAGFANRIRLDESAADIFSNAKHNAIAKSGRVTLTTIYRSRGSGEAGSQAYDAINYKFGKGLKSTQIFDLRRDN